MWAGNLTFSGTFDLEVYQWNNKGVLLLWVVSQTGQSGCITLCVRSLEVLVATMFDHTYFNLAGVCVCWVTHVHLTHRDESHRQQTNRTGLSTWSRKVWLSPSTVFWVRLLIRHNLQTHKDIKQTAAFGAPTFVTRHMDAPSWSHHVIFKRCRYLGGWDGDQPATSQWVQHVFIQPSYYTVNQIYVSLSCCFWFLLRGTSFSLQHVIHFLECFPQRRNS